MRSTEASEGSTGGSDDRVSYMARYLDGNVSFRIVALGLESAARLDKRVSARFRRRAPVFRDRDS